ncbi:MAG: hypothetical protein IJ693_00740 [Bacteroidaceae bacterium]|nr:hypothetical protein [Bacteroidaceae bacterium]
MASFKNMEIAPAVTAHENIYVRQGFLGFNTKIYYKPTLSLVDCTRNYYALSSGNEIQQFLLKFQNNPTIAEKTQLRFIHDPNGNYCLEMCASSDGQFVALQLFRYSDLAYNAVTDIKIYEGKEAELLYRVLRHQ